VPDWRRHRLLEERTLRHLLKRLKVDCVFDVGANTGGYAMMLRDHCDFSGYIISFEPTPDVFASLEKAARGDFRWKTIPSALGDSNGTATLHIHRSRMGTSFLPVVASDANSPGNIVVDEVQVPVATLDSIFPAMQNELKFERPFLKMDTQGFDMAVFKGGSSVLSRFVGLQSELSIAPYYDGAALWLDSLAAYEKAGFVLAALVPSSAGMGQLHEIDCIMFRR
jgi:FkbM family methyltransferase